ncbi:hypothetical protein [Mucilaginibacter sp.]|uniref:hypothetical protein n=1 Tax=Mucilaginibacter sp. TaxID=1882438 RepID=UPI00261311E4|nr:hypothetical protein [Mucilaginibacter sp.]MDB4926875.1 glycoside hydrolase [Mucilaginibacter sp.]
MKRKISTTILLLCSVFVCLAAIADLTGNWKGVIKMGDGNELPLTYVFKVDGEKLTGSVISANGEIPMTEGKVNGADFTFKIDVNGTTIVNIGKYYGDSTVVNSDFNGRKLHIKLIRADK